MVQVVITNNLRITGLSMQKRLEITKELTVDNPDYLDRKRKKRPTWGVDSKLKLYSLEGNTLVVPRGYIGSLTDWLQGAAYTIVPTMVDRLRPVDFGEWNPAFKMKEDQKPAVKAIVGANGVLNAPAGSGKTIMLLRAIFENGLPALWVTHTLDLLYQTKEKAEQVMPNIGTIGVLADGERSWGSGKLIIATVQTLQGNDELLSQLNQFIGTVVVDECHRVPSSTFMDVCGKLSPVWMLGGTATTDRKDGLQCYMYATIGPKLYEITRDGMYESGRLIKPEIKFHYTSFDYEQGLTVSDDGAIDAGGDDFNWHELMRNLINDEERLNYVAQSIADCNGYQIVISDSIPYCHKIYDRLVTRRPDLRVAVVHGTLQKTSWRVVAGKNAAMDTTQRGEAINAKYDARARRWKVQVLNYTEDEYRRYNISTAERKVIMREAAERKYDVLIATGQLVQEGLDLPFLEHGHLVTPKRGDSNGAKNGISVEQAVGRIQRVDPLNPAKRAVWNDYVDDKVGVLKSQYHSRRTVYKRLGFDLPRKKTQKDLADMLANIHFA